MKKVQTGGGAKKKRSDSDVDEPPSPRKKSRVETKKKGATAPTVAEVDGDKGEQAELYADVLDGMRRNESAVIDTRLNFTYGLPKRARIPRTREQWRSWQNVKGKLTNNYAQIDLKTVKIEGPLTLVDIQPVRADSNNYRYLTEEEIVPKLRSLPRSVLLGSPVSIATHPRFGNSKNFLSEVFPSEPVLSEQVLVEGSTKTDPGNDDQTRSSSSSKKPTLQQEWIYWLRDSNNRHFPMTQAAFAHLYRIHQIPTIQINSPSGFMLLSDEDRIFVIPKDFCPTTSNTSDKSSDQTTTLNSSGITPAVQHSKSLSTILPTPT